MSNTPPNAWIIYRSASFIEGNPVDVYFVFDIRSDELLAGVAIEEELSAVFISDLLDSALAEHGSWPQQIWLLHTDPAIEFVSNLCVGALSTNTEGRLGGSTTGNYSENFIQSF